MKTLSTNVGNENIHVTKYGEIIFVAKIRHGNGELVLFVNLVRQQSPVIQQNTNQYVAMEKYFVDVINFHNQLTLCKIDFR